MALERRLYIPFKSKIERSETLSSTNPNQDCIIQSGVHQEASIHRNGF